MIRVIAISEVREIVHLVEGLIRDYSDDTPLVKRRGCLITLDGATSYERTAQIGGSSTMNNLRLLLRRDDGGAQTPDFRTPSRFDPRFQTKVLAS